MAEHSKKNLFLIFHGRFPGEKAAALFTAKNAEAFAEEGFQVTVLAPRRLGRSPETPEKYYGVKETFRTVYLPIIDLFATPLLKWFAFYTSYILFSVFSLFYLLAKAKRNDILYSNESLPLLLASFFFKNTFYEVHDFPERSFLNRTLFSRVKGIVATNRWKRDELTRLFGLAPDKVLYEPNAVDVEKFKNADGNAIRRKLNISNETILIGYAGSLRTMEMEKGISVLLEAVAELPTKYHLLVVGGSVEDISIYRNTTELWHIRDRVIFTGWVRHHAVQEYLAACSVLVAPFPNTPHYNLYMSPMKVFEYMATGKPIVATKLRTIEEILDERSAVLVRPDDARALADGITKAVSGQIGLSAQAFSRVNEHTWQKRASRVTEFLLKKKV